MKLPNWVKGLLVRSSSKQERGVSVSRILLEDTPMWVQHTVLGGVNGSVSVSMNRDHLIIREGVARYNGKQIVIGKDLKDVDSEDVFVAYSSLPAWAKSEIDRCLWSGSVCHMHANDDVLVISGNNAYFNGRLVLMK